MKPAIVGRTVLVGLALATASAAFVGCSGASPSTGPTVSPHSEQSTGTIGLQLTLPDGEAIGTIAYTIDGPNTYAGTEDVSGTASTFSFVIPNVAPGSGYTVTLTATSLDGAVTCEGTSSAFSVAANQTTAVNVLLACTTTSEVGAVLVDGTGFDCATWHTAIANPATAATGGTVSLVGSASGPDPSALTYQWSAPTGTLTNATSANATFTCPPTPGEVTITLTVGDGTVPQGGTCPADRSTTTLKVMCEPAMILTSTCSVDQTGTGLTNMFCVDATHAHIEGEPGVLLWAFFKIANEGANATGPLDLSFEEGSDFLGDCYSSVLAPGASCMVYFPADCAGVDQDSWTINRTETLSDPNTGVSLTVGVELTCSCSQRGGRCVYDSNCCPGAAGPRPCLSGACGGPFP